jgi:hypothetical protein
MTALHTEAREARTAHVDDGVVLLSVDLGTETRYAQFATREEASAAGRLLREVGFTRSVRVLVDGHAVVWS